MTPEKHSNSPESEMAEKANLAAEVESSGYKILTREYYNRHLGGHGVEASWQSDAEMRAEYVGLTFDLIEQVIEGDYDTVLFLDKSGRPVSWLMSGLWDSFTDKPKPEIKYVNIDANRMLGHADDAPRPTSDEVVAFSPSSEDVHEIRNIYRKSKQEDSDTYLDNKNILVVDEVRVSGATANITEKLLKSSFPSSRFEQYHWLRGATKTEATFNNGHEQRQTFVTKLPVWYHSYDARGRGVGDVEVGQSKFVSSPQITYHEPDGEQVTVAAAQEQLSLDLRADIAQLAAEVMSGQQAVQPRGKDRYYYFASEDGTIDYDRPRFKLMPADPEAYAAHIKEEKDQQDHH